MPSDSLTSLPSKARRCETLTLFFDSERYDLSTVGRVKMNARLNIDMDVVPDTVRHLRKDDILRAAKGGACGYVVKPFNKETLADKIHLALKHRGILVE